MKILISFLILFTVLQAEGVCESKHLKNKDRAEVYAEKLLDKGDYTLVKDFLNCAINKKGMKSATIYLYLGDAYIKLDQLKKAKIELLHSIKMDPNNELIAKKIQSVEYMIEASENDDLGDALDLLYDKGFDFLMIFLAILAGEVIARQYTNCGFDEEKKIVVYYTSNLTGFFNHISAITKAIQKNYTFMCFVISSLIVMIYAGAFTIIFIILELKGISPGTIIDPINFTTHSIMMMTFYTFFIVLIVVLFIHLLFHYRQLWFVKLNRKKAIQKLADKFQTLALNYHFDELREYLVHFKNKENELHHIFEFFISKKARKIVDKLREE